jgi:predicted glycoside hydrolase/deacetylase ChbG (UPF0249 family)
MSNESQSRRTPSARSLPTVVAVAAFACAVSLPPAAVAAEAPRQLVVRCDDLGMCHAVNLAVRKLLASGIPFSASVMFACPWYQEAVAILAQHPEVGVGVHLTLNSEWEHYRWGPVLGRSKVPSLVDANGYFLPSEEAFAARAPDIREVEAELRAQIERALASGLHIDYLDAHMQAAYSTPELRALVEKLAHDYKLGISTYFGERSASLWDVPPEQKLVALLRFVRESGPGLTLLVAHLGLDDSEMTGLVDLNYPQDPFRVGRHRQAELDALMSPAFRAAVAAAGLELVTYRQIIERKGLGAMAPPAQASGYSTQLAVPK